MPNWQSHVSNDWQSHVLKDWQSHVSNDWRSHVSNDCSFLLEVNLVRPRVWLLVSTHLPPKHLRRERCEKKKMNAGRDMIVPSTLALISAAVMLS